MRVHGPFVSRRGGRRDRRPPRRAGTPSYVAGITDSARARRGRRRPTPPNAARLMTAPSASSLRDGKPSTSYLQRRLSIGYNRAASLIERMERERVIGPAAERRSTANPAGPPPRRRARPGSDPGVARGRGLATCLAHNLDPMFGQTTGIGRITRVPHNAWSSGEANERTNWRDPRRPWRLPPLSGGRAGWQKGRPPNPAAATSPWAKPISRDASVVGEQLDKKQVELVQKVSGYFNQMGDMKGLLCANQRTTTSAPGANFYVKRPGRFPLRLRGRRASW